MFEKLLALLPYNPGMSHQLAFYARRMREEAAIRRTGVIFLVLAFAVQFFAVVSPPQSTSAASNNDLINGGFSSVTEAANDCSANTEGYGVILANYGITCKEVANSPTVTIKSTDHNRQLYSMGRLPYGLAGETPVTIKGATYYFRYLWSWDKGGPASSYKALRILSQDGTLYYLLYGCGNVVSVGLPKPYSPPGATFTTPTPTKPTPTPPKIELTKTSLAGYAVPNSNVAPGTTLGYRVYVQNLGETTAQNVSLNDVIPAGTTFVSQSLNAGAKTHTYNSGSHTAQWAWDTIPQEVNKYTVDLVVKVNASDANGQKLCNQATASGNGISTVTSNQVCMTVVVNAPPPTTTTTTTPPTTTTPVCQYNSSLPADSPQCFPPCQYNGAIAATDSQCKPCEASQSSSDTQACVTVHKTASDVTTGVADANNTTVKGGDAILYTLYATNGGKASVDKFSFQENLSDVMDYADPTDLHGGTIDSNNIVSWQPVSIPAGQTVSKQITVTVKSPIPQTPADPADPGHFDLVMTNVYGNTININLPGSPAKSVETTAASLPNTGPGTGLFIGALVVIVAGYFYGRARLLAKESVLAIQETTAV